MHLRGQSESGYAMVALLIAMSIMAMMMTVAMPVYRQDVQREKETELVFRGQQYARAIGLFERKYANTPPPDFDVLVREHFLRKKYKDPITNKDFLPIPAGQGGAATPGATTGRGAAPGNQPPARQLGTPANPAAGQAPAFGAAPATGSAPATGAGGTVTGGIVGVVSSSKDKSIRIYNGGTHYNEWRFTYSAPAATPGVGAPGAVAPGGRGQRGQPGQLPAGVPPGLGGRGGFDRGGFNRGGPDRGGQPPQGPQRGQPPGQGPGPTFGPSGPGRGR